jgi:hypothetical protein
MGGLGSGSSPKKIKYKISSSGCWICTSHSYSGHGRLTRGTELGREPIHNWIYKTRKGEIPVGKIIITSCRNKSCINPDHIVAVGGPTEKEVRYSVNENGCWICTSHIPCDDGYINKRTEDGGTDKLHRIFYRKHKGEIPNHLILRHTCDVRNCINPDHLIPGTHQDNSNDMVERNRQHKAFGEDSSYHKLTNEDVIFIRTQKGKMRALHLSQKFNVDLKTIYNVWSGKSWKHLL